MTAPDAAHEARERNGRVQARYDELMAEGKHGHYETMFRVVREEVERAMQAREARIAELEAALRVLAEEAGNFGVSGVYFHEKCMGHKGLDMAYAALASQPGATDEVKSIQSRTLKDIRDEIERIVQECPLCIGPQGPFADDEVIAMQIMAKLEERGILFPASEPTS